MKLRLNNGTLPVPGVIAALLLLALWSLAFAEGVTRRIRFARGHSSTVIKGAVIRGERDRYLLGAKAGQKLSLRITAVENNAVFQIYKPKHKGTLKGAGELDDAQRWSGKLPISGDYVVVVGGTRGNATYSLKVTIQ